MKRFGAALVCGLLAASLQAWPLPPALELGHLVGKGLPVGVPPVPLSDELYALAWSRTNAFAVLERRTVGEGEREVRLRVYDLVEDRILWEVQWSDWGDEAQKQAWWNDHQAELAPVFERFRLEPNAWQLGVFPLILDNEYYTVALRREFSPREPDWIDGLELLVHSTGRGLKQVTTLKGYWRWAGLVGFVPSPYENRLAIVLLVQPSGWQGIQQPLRFVIAGLSLKAGFSAP